MLFREISIYSQPGSGQAPAGAQGDNNILVDHKDKVLAVDGDLPVRCSIMTGGLLDYKKTLQDDCAAQE